jgi:hypothetical protein
MSLFIRVYLYVHVDQQTQPKQQQQILSTTTFSVSKFSLSCFPLSACQRLIVRLIVSAGYPPDWSGRRVRPGTAWCAHTLTVADQYLYCWPWQRDLCSVVTARWEALMSGNGSYILYILGLILLNWFIEWWIDSLIHSVDFLGDVIISDNRPLVLLQLGHGGHSEFASCGWETSIV